MSDDYPCDPADYPAGDEDDELSDEDMDKIIVLAEEEDPEAVAEIRILRQFPTLVKAIARAVRCTERIQEGSDFPRADGSDDERLVEMICAEEQELAAELEAIIEEE